MIATDSTPIYFWQNQPAIHQSGLLSALSTTRPVTLVTEGPVEPRRVEMGWPLPDFGSARVVISPSRAERLGLIDAQPPGTVNIFSGISAYPETSFTLEHCIKSGRSPIGLYLEAWDSSGLRGRLRSRVARRAASRLRSRVDFVLALGELGNEQYRSAGFGESVRRFAYFFDTSPDGPSLQVSSSEVNTFRLAYVGRVDENKGLRRLIRALAEVSNPDWALSVIGDGPDVHHCVALSERLGMADRITWAGFVPHSLVGPTLRECDLLVLPSRYDGWGAVVNEALMNGCRALVSRTSGASCLVEQIMDCGRVFDWSDLHQLSSALTAEMDRGPVVPSERVAIAGWARRVIGGQAGADYLVQILSAVQGLKNSEPVPPWEY